VSDERRGLVPGASSANGAPSVPLDRQYDGRYRGGRGAPVAVEHEHDGDDEEHERRASRFAAWLDGVSSIVV
jgi:hypothetical protein